jgi:hypothetical protein
VKRPSRVLVCLTILVSLGTLLAVVAGAQRNAGPAVLERLPYSGDVLMARSIAAGRVILPNPEISRAAIHPVESCSPAPCILPNVDASEGGTNPVNEDPIAANPSNPLQWTTGGNDYNCSSVQGFFATKDNGATFTRTCLATLSGQVGVGDPIVGYDRSGNVYVGGIDANSSITTGQIVIAKSKNGGMTFSAPHSAVKSLSGGLTDKEWMEIDTNPSSPFVGTIYISLTDFSPTGNSQITVSHSTNGGATFKTVKVGTQEVSPAVNQFTDLAIAKDGTVYVSYIDCPGTGSTGDCGGTSTKILVSKSTDGGNTWSAPVTATTVTLAPDTCSAYYGCIPNTSERVSNIPVIAVDTSSGASSGKVYIAFYHWTGVFMSVRVVSSVNGGTTWSAQIPVAPASDTHDQFFPWVNVSSGGMVGVTFLDRRNDAANVNYQAFAALSKNGTTFSNTRLASASSNPNNDGFGGTFMGDYTGNVWNGKSLLDSWMDMRSLVSQDEVGGITVR